MADPLSPAGTATVAPGPSGRFLASAAVVSVAFLGVNALSYVFTVVAARSLAPAAYGELAALLSLLLVGSVPATGVQTATALVLGGRPGGPGTVARLHATAWVVGLAVGAVGLLAAVPVRAALHLPGTGAVLWLAAMLLPHTLVQGYQGLLQGSGRYRRLVGITVGFGVTKLAGGLAGLLLGGTPAAALAGMAAGSALGALAGWVGAGRPGLAGGLGPAVTASARAAGALLGFVVLMNLDVLLARHHLPAAASGEYAVAAVVTKVAFWLPQGVGVVLLPRLADAAGRQRALPWALAAVAGLGAVLTLGAAVLGGAVPPLIGGSAYAGTLGSAVWVFAALGTLLALAQLLLFSGIASADRFATVAVWAAAAAEGAVVEALAATGRLSLLPLAGTATLTAAVLVATGVVRLLRSRPVAPAGAAVPAPGA
ncbi:hypothetical protein [Blastococcus sp. SYSU DS0619]